MDPKVLILDPSNPNTAIPTSSVPISALPQNVGIIAAGTVSVGDVGVASNVDGTVSISKITASLFLASRQFVGIIVASATLGQTAGVQRSGTVAAVVTGNRLTGSGPSDVIADLDPVSATYGKPIRTANYQPGQDCFLGVANAQGVLTLGGNSISSSPIHGTSMASLDIGNADRGPAMAGAINAVKNGYVPEGVHNTSTMAVLNYAAPILRGHSRDKSILKCTSNSPFTFIATCVDSNTTNQAAAAALAGRLEISDLSFDMNNKAPQVIEIQGRFLRSITLKRLRFFGSTSGVSPSICIRVDDGVDVDIEDIEMDGAGQNQCAGIDLRGHITKTRIRNIRGTGMQSTFTYTPAGAPALHGEIDVADLWSDGMWYTGIPLYFGSGGTVTFTGFGLVDTSQNFNFGGTPNVVALTQRSGGVGTIATPILTSRFNLVTSGTTLTTCGWIEGEIILAGPSASPMYTWPYQSVLRQVLDNTHAEIEPWRDLTNGMQIVNDGPPTGWSVAICKTIIACVNTVSSGNALTVINSWNRRDGVIETPANGSLYRVIPQGLYQFFVGVGTSRLNIHNAHITRPYGDAFGLQGVDELTMSQCSARDTFDEGLTLNGIGIGGITGRGKGTITDFYGRNLGSGTYLSVCRNVSFINPVIERWGLEKDETDFPSGGPAIAFFSCKQSRIIGGTFDGHGLAASCDGIFSVSAVDCDILDNRCHGVTRNTLTFVDNSGEPGSGCRIRHFGSMAFAQTSFIQATPPLILDGNVGTSPLGKVLASVGSQMTDDTGLRYVKRNSVAKRGWEFILSSKIVFDATLITSSRLACWMRVTGHTTVVAGKATVISDLSAEGKNFTDVGSTGGLTYTASDSTFNNMSTVSSTASAWLQQARYATSFGTGPRTIIWVGQVDNAAGYKAFFSTSLDDATVGYADAFGSTFAINQGTQQSGFSPTISASAPAVFAFTCDPADATTNSFIWYENSSIQSNSRNSTGNHEINSVTLGTSWFHNAADPSYTGLLKIAELVIYQGKITADEMAYAAFALGEMYGLNII